MSHEYISPEFGKDAFNCPWCGVYSRQTFAGAMRTITSGQFKGAWSELEGYHVSFCDHCEKISIWQDDLLIHPRFGTAPDPHADMPENVRAEYVEARSVADLSPRSAAALLRLALQKLCAHLGEPGDNINDDIASLVKKGLDPNVQRALDILRISGNNAVHPGELDLKDDRDTVAKLFRLSNLVVQQMITQPRDVAELWEQMPERARTATADRDSQNRSK